MAYTLELKQISPITHDTYHLVFDRPADFDYLAGQAVDLSILKDGWENEGRAFTPITLPEEATLEFIIKAYPDHKGMSEQVGNLVAGDRLKLSGPFGDISDHGPGVFIAGGAGITPMIAIMRKQMKDHGTLEGSTLLFANKAERDIIWRDRFEAMKGLKTGFVVDEKGASVPQGRLDRAYLSGFIVPDSLCYLCGPPPMMDAVRSALQELGVSDDRIIEEKF